MKWAQYYDEQMIRKAIKVLKPNNALFEIRVIKKGARKTIISGYFTDADTLIEKFDTIDPRQANTYITLNAINVSCYSREQKDCFRQTDTTTNNHEIDKFEWLFIDLDPERLAEISSSDAELTCSQMLADKVYEYMKGLGFYEPIRALSGNGHHLLYKIDLQNTTENGELMKRCLAVLADLFNDGVVKIDTVNHNPARICKLYGSLAQKGSNTKERPHRMSMLTSVPDVIEVNDISLLQKLASELPDAPPPPQKARRGSASSSTTSNSNNTFDLEEWMDKFGLDPMRKDTGTNCDIYPLRHCPFNESHTNGDSKIFHYSDGAIAFKCHHNSCKSYKWQDVREKFEPGVYDRNQDDEERDRRIEEGWRQHRQYIVVNKTNDIEEVKKGLPKLKAISASALQSKVFEERYYAVNDMIPEGETVIAAPPKTGKSWLMLDMCLQVAKGKPFLGFSTKQSDTLYLALEDGDSFEQERLNIVLDGEQAPDNFHFVFENVMPMNEGFLLQLDELLKEYPNVKVVVIDTLQFIKYRQGKSESAYECDYRTGRDLKEYAERHKLAIVVVTHTTKMVHIEDDMANVSGTNGVTGAADSVIVLSKENRMDTEARMFITGRKVRQSLHNIKFEDAGCRWNYVGVAEITTKDRREQEERERQYENSKIREAVIQISINLKEPWKGRAGQIIELAAQHGIGLRESNKEIGGFLNKMQGLFMDMDNILIEKIKNGNAPWIYKIYPKSDNYNPFLKNSTIDTIDAPLME